MKRLLTLMLLLGALAGGAAATPEAGELARSFAAPPDSAKPWVYWFWSDGAITREGITADLEAMKRQGIAGVLIMEVDQGPPKGPARYMSPQWRELFKFMLTEARRLGIEVNMNNDAGWCGSGGPWVTPDKAMQKVVWTETFVNGPRRVEAPLAQPETVADFYQDIAVLAFPSPAGEGERLAAAQPRLTASLGRGFSGAALIDGDPATAVKIPKPAARKTQFVQLEFAKPFPASRLALTIPLLARQGYSGRLQVSSDGRKWNNVATFNQAGGGANFPRVESRLYRIVFTTFSKGLSEISLAEVELSQGRRIDGFVAKSGMAPVALDPDVAEVAPDQAVAPGKVLDLTARFKDGRLAWEAPEGRWTILRLGHTATGKDNHPAPEEGRGLECDKLSKAGIEQHFNGLMAKLLADSGPDAVKTMTTTHIDSWEVGCQNWTPAMREAFQKRRGYDPFPYLPAMTGRIVGGAEASERFLWDLRRTISEMVNDNYASGLWELAKKNGLKLSIEAYSGGPFDPLSYSGRCDIPIGEFWTQPGLKVHASLKPMASGGHIYGNQLVAAEAFTATNGNGRQRNHPGSIKALGDVAFCEGINRFIFHRYSLQPWVSPVRAPGMTMGPWGLEYERTATWWEKSGAWHQYLARCQYLLQQGIFQADLLYLNDEEGFTPIKGREQMTPPVPEGYDYDQCAPEAVLTRMSVEDGFIAVKGGMRYRALVLPQSKVMTPELLGKIKALVEAGATVVGAPPQKSPSLVNYPQCDAEVKKLVGELWADLDGKTRTERACGKGWVIWGKPLGEALKEMKIAPDFAAQTRDQGAVFHYIHRRVGESEIYFVASGAAHAVDAVCAFRVEGRLPELWRPDSGAIEPVSIYEAKDGRVRVPIHFDPSGSVFVVFRKSPVAPNGIVQVDLNGKPVISTAWDPAREAQASRPEAPDNNAGVKNSFTMAAWVKPATDIDLPAEKNSGPDGTRFRRNDVIYPAPGHEVYARPGEQYNVGESCAGLSAGDNGVAVFEHGDYLMAPVLVVKAPLTAMTHLAVVYRDGTPTLYINGKKAKDGLKTGRSVHPALGVRHARGEGGFEGERAALSQFDRPLDEAEIADLMKRTAPKPSVGPEAAPAFTVAMGENGELIARAGQGGAYALKTAAGRELKVQVPNPPAPLELAGPWQVSFPPKWGAPPQAAFDKLVSWTERPEPGIKYFSGTATYKKTFDIPQSAIGDPQSAMFLDLGDVQVMAQVKLNGKDLGILWKAPYRVEITGAAKTGKNELEVEVVNLWVNRLIGDEFLPEDCAWKDMGARGWVLAEYPKWLLDGKPSPTGRFTFKTWKHYTKDSPLLPSGLLGPVRVEAESVVTIPPQRP